MTPEHFGYAAMIAGALIVALAMAMSYVWHKRDAAMPDPRGDARPWDAEEWARYHNRLHAQRLLQHVGLGLLYLGSALGVVGFAIVGIVGLTT